MSREAPEQSKRASLLLHRLDEVTREAVPSESDVPHVGFYILGMFWRSRRLLRGATALLDSGLPEEALIIGRSLFEDSLRLRQLAEEPANRGALMMGWVNSSLEEKKGLIRDAQTAGLEMSPDDVFDALQREQVQLQKYCRAHRISRLKKFLTPKDAALRYGRTDDYWTYALSHEMVHGSDAAWIYSRRKFSGDRVGVFAGTYNPTVVVAVASYVAASMVDAARSICRIFDRCTPPECQSVLDDFDALSRDSAG
jgi:hypothetical protein